MSYILHTNSIIGVDPGIVLKIIAVCESSRAGVLRDITQGLPWVGRRKSFFIPGMGLICLSISYCQGALQGPELEEIHNEMDE